MTTKNCKHCGGSNHTSLMCFKKKRKPITSFKTKINDNHTRVRWLYYNPPVNGYWQCSLRISRLCPGRLDEQQMTLDHIKPKGSHPELRHKLDNLWPVCVYCNGLKGSRSMESLKKQFPHLN